MTGATSRLVVLAAGGTGGHVFPAEALAVELAGRGCRLALVTDRRGGALDGHFSGVEIHHIRAGGVAGKSFAARLRSAPELALGTVQAHGILKRLRPDAVVGFGGYPSIPTMLAATFAGHHTAIHEQNAVLGRANRLLASRVESIATSFAVVKGLSPESAAKVVHTGMPVRPAIAAMRDRPYPPLGADDPVRLLVLGGSQGARVLSEVVPRAVSGLAPELRRRLRITQQCRPEDLEQTRTAYADIGIEAELATFFGDVPDRLAATHLVITRSGASTVAEVTAVGRPAILVPYPFATDDHQTANAHSVDETGAGWLMPQESFTPETLAARLQSLISQPATLDKAAGCARASGHPDAARRLADMVCRLLPSNGEPETRRRAA